MPEVRISEYLGHGVSYCRFRGVDEDGCVATFWIGNDYAQSILQEAASCDAVIGYVEEYQIEERDCEAA